MLLLNWHDTDPQPQHDSPSNLSFDLAIEDNLPKDKGESNIFATNEELVAKSLVELKEDLHAPFANEGEESVMNVEQS